MVSAAQCSFMKFVRALCTDLQGHIACNPHVYIALEKIACSPKWEPVICFFSVRGNTTIVDMNGICAKYACGWPWDRRSVEVVRNSCSLVIIETQRDDVASNPEVAV